MVWLISYTAMNGVAVLFPVVMTHQYALPAILAATAYAVGVAVSLLLYGRVSALAGRHGAGRVLTKRRSWGTVDSARVLNGLPAAVGSARGADRYSFIFPRLLVAGLPAHCQVVCARGLRETVNRDAARASTAPYRRALGG